MRDLGPQFEQLAAFHQAGDFIQSGKHNDAKIFPMDVDDTNPSGGHGRYETMWNQKRAAIASGHGSMSHHMPVDVHHPDDSDRSPFDSSDRAFNQPALYDGHHRVVEAYDKHGPRAEIAVEHLDDRNIGTGSSEPNPKMLSGYRPPKKSR